MFVIVNSEENSMKFFLLMVGCFLLFLAGSCFENGRIIEGVLSLLILAILVMAYGKENDNHISS